MKIKFLPPVAASKQLTAFRQVRTMRERVLAFLNANNKDGFEPEETKIEPIASRIIRRIKKARRVGVSVSDIQMLENPQPKHSYDVSVPSTKSDLNSYAAGLRELYQRAAGSAGAKSLVFSRFPLQDTEYLARREKLLKEMSLEGGMFRKHIFDTRSNFSFKTVE